MSGFVNSLKRKNTQIPTNDKILETSKNVVSNFSLGIDGTFLDAESRVPQHKKYWKQFQSELKAFFPAA